MAVVFEVVSAVDALPAVVFEVDLDLHAASLADTCERAHLTSSTPPRIGADPPDDSHQLSPTAR